MIEAGGGSIVNIGSINLLMADAAIAVDGGILAGRPD